MAHATGWATGLRRLMGHAKARAIALGLPMERAKARARAPGQPLKEHGRGHVMVQLRLRARGSARETG